ncbi:MAG: hypothetical protein ACOY94_19600 [Bacillota bacterium]
MAREKATGTTPAETSESQDQLRTIEDLAKQAKTPDWVLAGAKVHYGWGAGKKMTEQEYRKAISRWLGSPIGGDKR